MARKKNKSMKWQVEAVLLSMLCIGQSRHEAKAYAKQNGHTTPTGIYSWSTYNTYKKHCIYFAQWAKDTHQCKTLDEAFAYVQEYIDSRVAQGLSAWTVKTEASAIAKMYGHQTSEWKLSTPNRKRKDIRRSRVSCEHGKHISEDNHNDIIMFSKGCGLRRHELEAHYTENIIVEADKVYIEVLQGKGGKRRTVQVLPKYKDYIGSFYKDEEKQLVFDKIPQNLDIHSFRADFACEWYKLLARPLDSLASNQKYYCKGDRKGVIYDRKAMMTVSKLLGHNRINVIASNYLWKL